MLFYFVRFMSSKVQDMNKFIHYLLCSILLLSCGKSYDLDKTKFSPLPEGEFTTTNAWESSNQITKPEDVAYFMNQISPKMDVQEEFNQGYAEYYYFFHKTLSGTENLEVFAIASGPMNCDYGTYMIVTKNGKISDGRKILNVEECGDYESNTIGHFSNGGKTLVAKFKGYSGYELKPDEYIDTCTVNSEGKLECKTFEIKKAVCLWEKVSVRESPEGDSKYLTSAVLGEEVIMLGQEKEIESNGKTERYFKILLSDGTKGWADERFFAKDGTVSAVIRETPIYKRPDISTISNDKFQAMDIIALTEMKEYDGWVRVRGIPKGESWFKEGWLQNRDNLTRYNLDITVASMAKTALKEKNDEKRVEKLRTIFENGDLQNSNFISEIAGLLGESQGNKDFMELIEQAPLVSLPYNTDGKAIYDEERYELSIDERVNFLNENRDDVEEGKFLHGYFKIGNRYALLIKESWAMGYFLNLTIFNNQGEKIDELEIFRGTSPMAPEREDRVSQIDEDFNIEINIEHWKIVDPEGNLSDGSDPESEVESSGSIVKYSIDENGIFNKELEEKVEDTSDLPLYNKES